MYFIRNIRWIDLIPRERLSSSPTEGKMMKGQKGYVLAQKFSLQGFSLSRLWHRVWRWHQLNNERAMLASLSDDALKDLGLSRADVEHEAVRRFWDDPLQK
jgi:uncharacterized protein YjiS (DUF1127 family)